MRWNRLSRPAQVTVKLSIPMFGEVTGQWAPVDAERKAAWELYVELITRVAVVQLAPGEGLLREALTSLYSLFGTTRDILRRHGPQVAPRRAEGEVSFGSLAVSVLNGAVRPLLTRWHPALLAYEATRAPGTEAVEHERGWERSAELRAELAGARHLLADLAAVLAEVSGAADLIAEHTENPETAGGGVGEGR